MKLKPQLALSFNGNCEAAFRHYERCLSGTITFMMTWADAPSTYAPVPPGWESKIYHATLKLGDTEISGADVPPDLYTPPAGFSVTLQMDDPAAAERVFERLAEGGTIKAFLQETFWAARFGAVIDRFGIEWAVNCEQPANAAP
jgi:PhnB protein